MIRPLVFFCTITLTFILFRCFISHNIAKNFAIGLDRRVPADLQCVHGNLVKLEVNWGLGYTLQGLDGNGVGAGALASWVKGQNRNAIIGVHLQENEAVGGVRGRNNLDLFRITTIDRNRVIEDLVA